MKEGWRNVGGPAWFWSSPGKGRYKVEAEILSEAM